MREERTRESERERGRAGGKARGWMRERRMPRCGSVSGSIILEDSKGWSQRRNPRVAGPEGATQEGRGSRGERNGG